MSTYLTAAMAPVALSTQGLVTYLQGLFGPLFLGIVGIVAIFFLFTREITRFVQFMVLAIAVVFYTPSIVQTLATALPPGAFTWLPARPVSERKRLPELVSSQLRYIAEPRTMCRMAPFAEKDELLVPPGYATGIRPRTRAKKVSFVARQCERSVSGLRNSKWFIQETS